MSLTDSNYEQYWHEFFIQSDAQLKNEANQVAEGELSVLDLAVKYHNENKVFEEQITKRKEWLTQNLDVIADQSEKYGKQGYKGKIFIRQTKKTLSFKHIPQWQEFEKQKKDFEEKSKLALRMVERGGMNVDETGEEIPLPEVSYSSFLKVDKVK